MFLLTWRADHKVYHLFMPHPQNNGCNIIIRFIQIQIQAGLCQIACHLLCAHPFMVFCPAESHYIISSPAAVGSFSHSGIGDTVGHNDQHILIFQFKTAFMDFLLFDHTCLHRIIKESAIPDQNCVRIIKLIKAYLFSLKVQHCKGGICQISHTAHRKRFRHCTHCLIQFHLINDHGTEHGRSQRGKDIRLYSAPKSVRKHQNMVFIIFFNLIAVPTEKFFLFIQAHMTKIHA